MSAPPRTPLRDLASLFLKLGTTAFGGPAAHVAMMEDEVVRRRGWLTRQQFLDYVGATNLIPGPNSTELAIHIGYARAGWAGLLVAGLSFILPATLIVSAVAWFYVRYGALPEAAGVLYGVKPVVVAVVAQALWGLGRTAARTVTLAMVGLAAVVALVAGVHELVVLAGAALVALALRQERARGARREDRARHGGVWLVQWRRGCPGAGGLRDGEPVRTLAAVSGTREDRVGALRQRVCAAGVPAG